MATGDADEDGDDRISPVLIHQGQIRRKTQVANPAHLIPINLTRAATIVEGEAAVEATADGVAAAETIIAKVAAMGTLVKKNNRRLAQKAQILRVAKVMPRKKIDSDEVGLIGDEATIAGAQEDRAAKAAVRLAVRLHVVVSLSGSVAVTALRKILRIALLSRLIEIHLLADREDVVVIGGATMPKAVRRVAVAPIAPVPNGGGQIGPAIGMCQHIQL